MLVLLQWDSLHKIIDKLLTFVFIASMQCHRTHLLGFGMCFLFVVFENLILFLQVVANIEKTVEWATRREQHQRTVHIGVQQRRVRCAHWSQAAHCSHWRRRISLVRWHTAQQRAGQSVAWRVHASSNVSRTSLRRGSVPPARPSSRRLSSGDRTLEETIARVSHVFVAHDIARTPARTSPSSAADAGRAVHCARRHRWRESVVVLSHMCDHSTECTIVWNFNFCCFQIAFF